jgi:asparagine synthase (glutamine-hydrolysing)
MFWFGGFSGPRPTRRIPVEARDVWSEVAGCWTVGRWVAHDVKTVAVEGRHVMVVGPCGISKLELERLASDGVPDDVAWKWSGSYTVVEVTASGTAVWTDLGGTMPIYTLAFNEGTMWASSSRALAGLTGQRIDWGTVGALLLVPEVAPLVARRSTFADIELVPSGHKLLLSSAGRCDVTRVWVPSPRSEENSAEALRRELAAGVAVRMDNAATPTSDLSGGYDSTALCLLAAEQIHPERCIVGVTVHPEGVTAGGDMYYARIAAQHPGIDHQLLPLGSDHSPYAELDAVPVTDEPAPSTVTHARFSAQLRWLRSEFGSDCHMTGDGGDGLLCTPPIFLADLVRTHRLPRLWTETLAWARLRRVAPWSLLFMAVRTAATDRGSALRELDLALSRGVERGRATSTEGGVSWFSSAPVPIWATRTVRARVASLVQAAAQHAEDGGGRDITSQFVAETMASVGRTAHADGQLAEFCGIPLHNPFVDSRVIDTYLAVPLAERPGPANYKPVLRRALADLLPPALAARTTKGDFNSDHHQGMRAAMPVLHKLADGHLAAHGLIDVAQVRGAFTAAAAGTQVSLSTTEPVVAIETWLRVLEATPSVRWTSDESERSVV